MLGVRGVERCRVREARARLDLGARALELGAVRAVAFSPDGVTGDVWAEAVAAFPSESIVNDYY